MGVDPGLTRCGLSVIESRTGRQVIALDVDVVRTPSGEPLAQRLLAISEAVEHWMDTHLPDVIAIERVFANANANTAMGNRAGRRGSSHWPPPAGISTSISTRPAKSRPPSPATAAPTRLR